MKFTSSARAAVLEGAAKQPLERPSRAVGAAAAVPMLLLFLTRPI